MPDPFQRFVKLRLPIDWRDLGGGNNAFFGLVSRFPTNSGMGDMIVGRDLILCLNADLIWVSAA